MKEEVYNRLADLGTARESMGSVVEKLMDDNEELRVFYEKYKDRAELLDKMEAEGMI